MNLSLSDVFFNLSYTNPTDLTIKILIFLGSGLVLGYLIYLLLSKVMGREESSDYHLKLNFLWAMVALMVVFSIYVFFLIRKVGLAAFRLDNLWFYIGALPQLLLLIGIVALFFSGLNRYEKSIQA